MKLFSLLLTATFLLPYASGLAAEKPNEEAAPLTVTCLIHEEGKDRLTQKTFSLKPDASELLFDVNDILYVARYSLDADYYNPGHVALTLEVHAKKEKALYSSRTTWAPTEKFNQLRLDVSSSDYENPGPSHFFLCSGKAY